MVATSSFADMVFCHLIEYNSLMYIFIDEAGDTGLKVDAGSSRFFVLSLVVFEDAEKERADQLITELKAEMGVANNYEFHFTKNSDRVRKKFLELISRLDFSFFSIVIDKRPEHLYGQVFRHKSTFYQYACNLVFTSAKPFLVPSNVILDKSGSDSFRTGLRKYLKTIDQSFIKDLKQQDSHKNNLLQVADYISSVLSRQAQEKKGWEWYYRFIEKKDNIVGRYP